MILIRTRTLTLTLTLNWIVEDSLLNDLKNDFLEAVGEEEKKAAEHTEFLFEFLKS